LHDLLYVSWSLYLLETSHNEKIPDLNQASSPTQKTAIAYLWARNTGR